MKVKYQNNYTNVYIYLFITISKEILVYVSSKTRLTVKKKKKKKKSRGFPGGAVVKNPPANAGDTGSSPGPGRSHTPQSN